MNHHMGALHCIVIIGIVATSAWWLYSHLERPTPVRIVVSMTFGPAFVLSAALMSAHNCAQGQPVQQWVIPGLMLCACWLFSERRPDKLLVLAGIWVLSLALSLHYAAIVHETPWLGVPLTYDESGHAINAVSEWHTPMSGLYRRVD